MRERHARVAELVIAEAIFLARGIAAKNEVFSRHRLNIDGQFLRTDPNLGYVVTDISASPPQAAELRNELAAIDGTVRTRVLY